MNIFQLNISDTFSDDEPLIAYQLWIRQHDAGETDRIGLDRHDTGANYTNIGLHTFTPITGPIHIEITRDTQGDFEVFLNGDTTPIIEATDNEITESTYFILQSNIGDSGIDNITVDNGSVNSSGIPGFTVGFVICTVTPTVIVLVIVRKRVKFKTDK